MLRVMLRKCFYCSKMHERGVEMRTLCTTSVTKATNKVEVECGGSTLEISSGKLARLADGTAVARLGNTSVMTTVVSKGKPSSQNFLPLTVDYRQKAAAAGRIPTNHLRREMGASDREILVGRMIDRSIRPLFPAGYLVETGLNCNLLSVDGVHDPEVLSINAASAALSLSDVPWGPAVGAVRVGWLNGRPVINPTRREMAGSEVNLVVAGTAEGLSTMLEGDARCLEYANFLEVIQVGLEHCARIAERIDRLASEVGKPKRSIDTATAVGKEVDDDLKYLVDTLCSAKLRSIYTDYSLDKQGRDSRMFRVREEMISQIKSIKPEADASTLGDLFSSISKDIVRNLIFQENIRVDGRSATDIRPISCDVNMHAPLHGSALFQRGQTQVLCTVALDSLQSALKLDPVTALTGGVKEKNFMLHYEFPGYATGELGRGGSRRELGHGALAERALRQVLPAGSQFTIRLTSEVLESNGSSSMASICGGSIALLDAGIPLSEMASGVAMGLVSRGHGNGMKQGQDGEYRVLTDIMGMEDFLGDMDFKFAATRSGVVALQADVKLSGISLDVIREAVEGGVEANHRILDIMASCIHQPREYKECWPVTQRLEVPPHKRGKFLGQAGLNVRKITQDTGVQIHPESEGVWQLFAPNPEAMAEAEAVIQTLLQEEKIPELEFGGIYTGRISEILDRGVMIQLHEQMSPVLLHNNQLSARKIQHPTVLGLKVGDELQVKYYGRDPATGQMRLSRKALTVSSAAAVKNLQNATKRKDGPDSPGGEGGPASPQGGPALDTPPPPRLNINENKADIYSPHVEQRDLMKGMEPARRAPIDTSRLFTPKVERSAVPDKSVLTVQTDSSEISGLNSATDVADFFATSQAVRTDLNEVIHPDRNPSEVIHTDSLVSQNIESSNTNNLSKNVESSAHQMWENLETIVPVEELSVLKRENDDIDSHIENSLEENNDNQMYYKIDSLFNQLMEVNIEIKEATLRKEKVDQEWGYVKETLNTLDNKSYLSSLLSQTVDKDKLKLYKKFSAQSKAINETLLLLTRQYRNIKAELETAKLSFIKAKDPSVVEEILKAQEAKQDMREVISDLVQETLKKSKFEDSGEEIKPPGRHSFQSRQDRKFDTHHLLTRDNLTKPEFVEFKPEDVSKPNVTKSKPTRSMLAINKAEPEAPFTKESKDDLLSDLSVIEDARKKLKLNLADMHIESRPSRRSKYNKKGIIPIPTHHKARLRKNILQNLKSDMDTVKHRFESDEGLPETLNNSQVRNFVSKNCRDFNTLMKWHQELGNLNEAKLKDVTEGIQVLHRNLMKNLHELDNNMKYMKYQRSGIEFIGRHLDRQDHPLVALAIRNMHKLEAIYNEKLEFLSKDCSLHNRQEQDPTEVWEEYHRARIQLKQIRKRLWEVELSEERMADLDDWRLDGEEIRFPELQERIDAVQGRIDGFSKLDIEGNWSTVEKNLHTLQGLKVEGLIAWLTEQTNHPVWLSQELKDHLLSGCYRYTELDNKRKDAMKAWLNLRGKDDSLDLSLDVLYSQIRSCMAKVKYASLENARHKEEVGIYSAWVHRFGSRLREQSRCQLQDMLKLAEMKVSEVDEAVNLYVGVIGKNQEYARDAATVLDKMREEKREVVRKVADSILYSCREVKYQGVQILNYDHIDD